MSKNPTIAELNGEDYTLIKELSFTNIKPFILNIIGKRNPLLTAYMVYQSISLLALIFLFLYHIYVAIKLPGSDLKNVYALLAGLLFSFSVLVVIHELIHAVTYYFLGKRQLKFGASLQKFIFYVHAHQQVVNRKEFMLVALAPFVLVHVLTLPFVVLHWQSPLSVFFTIVLLAHALFCAGDFAMISFSMTQYGKKWFTYDDSTNKTARFYIKKG